MTRFIYTIAVLSLGLISCTTKQSSPKAMAKVVTLEVSGNQVLLLDDKEVHVDYLSPLLASLNTEFDLTANLTISPDAQMGIVHDVQKALNTNAVQIANDEE